MGEKRELGMNQLKYLKKLKFFYAKLETGVL